MSRQATFDWLCDKCGATARTVSSVGGFTMPDGWATVEIVVAKANGKPIRVHACPDCVPAAIAAVRRPQLGDVRGLAS